jgi:peptide/nickel transport system permease protein
VSGHVASRPGHRVSVGVHPVLRYAVRRVLAGAGTLLVLSVLVFLATSVLPGDAASAVLGRNATGPALRELRQEMGLDQPIWVQYRDWLTGLLQGDLGRSVSSYLTGSDVSVWSQVGGKLSNSLTLAALAFAVIVPVSLAGGVLDALRAGRWQDHLISTVTLVPSALPEFVLGTVLLAVFFTWLDVLPPVSLIAPGTSPLEAPDLLVLPLLTLVGVTVGAAIRMIRAGMLDALAADYVTVARLNGIAEPRVVRRYALRNALAPSIQVFALIAQYLVGGLLIVEYMFAYPGIGNELVQAVTIHDNTEVRSVTMLPAAIYVALMILADVIVLLVVPKLAEVGGSA